MSNTLIKLALLMALAFLLAFGSSAAWASPATPTFVVEGLKLHPSDRGTPRSWEKIAADPFQGDHTKGGQVLGKSTNVPLSDFIEASAMRKRGECIVYHLQNGDELRTTFGKDRSAAVKVNFASADGHAERRGYVCVLKGDGTAVLFLDACGNVSVAQAIVKQVIAAPATIVTLPAPPPPAGPTPPIVATAAPPPMPRQRCVVVPLGTTVRYTPPVSVPALNGYAVSACGNFIYVPGTAGGTYAGGETRSSGFTISCVED